MNRACHIDRGVFDPPVSPQTRAAANAARMICLPTKLGYDGSSMFTGIIQHVGSVDRITATPEGKRLRLRLGPLTRHLAPGESVAVNGACLTASEIHNPCANFDVVRQTLARTTLGDLHPGDAVNLERAMRLDGRLDGHLVQGHVDGKARVERIDTAGGQWEMHFTAETRLTDQMVPKGSVALSGVSLTLVDVGEGTFSVALIPTTLSDTTLGTLGKGDAVNVETDVIGKYVQKFLARGSGTPKPTGLTLDALRKTGFA
jgi:riboflavin synthase